MIQTVFLILCLWLSLPNSMAGAAPTKCVQIFYDSVPNAKPTFNFSRIHTLFLENLLGHFPKIQQYVIPIEKYLPGQIEKCQASFYLGNYYDNLVPPAFLEDFVKTRRNVLWAGYNIWKLPPEALAKIWGVKFVGLSKLDAKQLDSEKRPGFFKYFEYLGETFTKYGNFDKLEPTRFNAAYEISLFDVLDPKLTTNVVSWARHSVTGEKRPYVLRNKNHWYIGDSPFAFATEDDRYLIFSDLLFDVLSESPRRTTQKKPALLRIEDIHPKTPLWLLYRATELLSKLKVPFTMSLIPIFTDPLRVDSAEGENNFVTVLDSPYFSEYLNYAANHGASFIMHGVTHQYRNLPNPFTGVSADDFEFWDRKRNKPIVEDSVKYVVERLEDGFTLLHRAHADPVAWLTPHYQASPLDFLLFGQLFSWNVGRVIYFPMQSVTTRALPAALRFDVGGVGANGQRLKALTGTEAVYDENIEPNGQFFPYEIYGDVYGQRVVPENIGNVQPYMNEQVLRTLSIDDMIRTLRRNRVLRDVWGSFFIHLFVLQDHLNGGVGKFPGDTGQLEKLVSAAQDAGYEFIDLKKWIEKNRYELRPPTIEVAPGTETIKSEKVGKKS